MQEEHKQQTPKHTNKAGDKSWDDDQVRAHNHTRLLCDRLLSVVKMSCFTEDGDCLLAWSFLEVLRRKYTLFGH